MTTKIKLTEQEYKKLLKLYKTAQTTPVIGLSSEELMTKGSWADQAWDAVREYMDELGKKYGYDPALYMIGKDGEVIKR